MTITNINTTNINIMKETWPRSIFSVVKHLAHIDRLVSIQLEQLEKKARCEIVESNLVTKNISFRKHSNLGEGSEVAADSAEPVEKKIRYVWHLIFHCQH